MLSYNRSREVKTMPRACRSLLRAPLALGALVLLPNILPIVRAAEIPKGARVLMRLDNSLSTRTAKVGDVIYMRTASPVVAGGRVVIPVGSYAQGTVSLVKRSGRVAGNAELGFRLDTITLPSGGVLQLSGTLDAVDSEGTDQSVRGRESTVQQGPSVGRDAGAVATTGAHGAVIGAIVDRSWQGAGVGAGVGGAVGLTRVLLTRGREVELRRGSTVDVVFDRPLSVH
jgi:hypothetical protein